MPNCIICGAKSLEEYCWKHKTKKSIKRPARPHKQKEEKEQMFQLFFELWDEKQERLMDRYIDYEFITCFETGRELERKKYKMLITCYHHLLEKESYPELALCKENIVILHPDIHTLVHQDIDKTPKVKEARELLYQKYLNGQIEGINRD